MHLRTLALSALAAAMAVGCASKQMEQAPAKSTSEKPAAAKPALMTGASTDMLVGTCFACHGLNGNSLGPATPTIAGMEADYLTEVMLDYKSGERVNTIMGRITKGYSDAEIEQIAEYFSQQSYKGVVQTSMGPKAKKGRLLHDEYCEKCHEDGGRSVEDTPLVGQWMPYVLWTISDYLDGHNNPEKKMTKALDKMMAEHSEMSRAQLAESLANYYGSQN